MKNKNIKNKPQKNVVDGFSCILDFTKFSGGGPPDPPCKGNTSSESFFNNNNSQRGNKNGKPSPIKTIYKKFMFTLYRNWKMEEGAGARSFLCDLSLGCLKLWFVL